MARTAGAAVILAIGIWSSPSLACHKIKICDYTENPPCHFSCPDLFVNKSGPAYSVKLERLDPKAASAVVNMLRSFGAARTNSSTVSIQGLNKSDIPQVLDKLNINKDSVHVPK